MPAPMHANFNGSNYVPVRDTTRLTSQLDRIYDKIKDGNWYTLADLCDAPEASVSAQLRHLRKPRFGSHKIEKEYLGTGLYRYRLL